MVYNKSKHNIISVFVFPEDKYDTLRYATCATIIEYSNVMAIALCTDKYIYNIIKWQLFQ